MDAVRIGGWSAGRMLSENDSKNCVLELMIWFKVKEDCKTMTRSFTTKLKNY